MKKNQEVIKVSDWSQKYKLAIYAISSICIGYLGYRVVNLLQIIAENTTK